MVNVVDAEDVSVKLFAHFPSLPGRQLTQFLPAFTQAQPLHKPVLLHLQHTILRDASSIQISNIQNTDYSREQKQGLQQWIDVLDRCTR